MSEFVSPAMANPSSAWDTRTHESSPDFTATTTSHTNNPPSHSQPLLKAEMLLYPEGRSSPARGDISTSILTSSLPPPYNSRPHSPKPEYRPMFLNNDTSTLNHNDRQTVETTMDRLSATQTIDRQTGAHTSHLTDMDESQNVRLSLSLHAKYELNHQMSFPSRVTLDPSPRVNLSNLDSSSRFSLDSSTLPIMFQGMRDLPLNQDMELSSKRSLQQQSHHQLQQQQQHIPSQQLVLAPPPSTQQQQLPPSLSNSNLGILEESRAISLPESSHPLFSKASGSSAFTSTGSSAFSDSHHAAMNLSVGNVRGLSHTQLTDALNSINNMAASSSATSSLPLQDGLTSVPRSPGSHSFSLQDLIPPTPGLSGLHPNLPTINFSPSPILSSSFIYPNISNISNISNLSNIYPQKSTQLLVPSGEKTYELLGHSSPSTSSMSQSSVEQRLTSMEQRSEQLDSSRSSTDGKYYKRRLSLSRNLEEKSSSFDIPRPVIQMSDNLFESPQKYNGGQLTPPPPQSSRIERPTPVTFQSSQSRHIDLMVGRNLSTMLGSAVSSSLSQADAAFSSLTRRGSEHMDPISVWRPY